MILEIGRNSNKSGYFNSSGFTLIEALVAVTLLSIGIISIFGVYHAGLTAIGAADNSLRADILFREQMDRFLSGDTMEASMGDTGGERPLVWRLDVKPVSRAVSGNLREITMTVTDKDGASRVLTSYACAPYDVSR